MRMQAHGLIDSLRCCATVHFGMSGRFNAAVGPAPEVRPTTRLALVNEEHNLVAHLSAMTVKHGGLGELTTSLLLPILCHSSRIYRPVDREHSLVAHFSAMTIKHGDMAESTVLRPHTCVMRSSMHLGHWMDAGRVHALHRKTKHTIAATTCHYSHWDL